MKGLLIKDFMLLKNQKSFIFMIIVFSVMFLFMNYNPTFIVSYSTIIGSLFVVSSISYDEYDNGYSFLMALPVTRRLYVNSKYVLALILGIGFWFASTALTCIYNYMTQPDINIPELLMTCTIMLGLMALFISFMVPVQLKFGQNRGNIALVAAVGCCVAIGFVLIQLAEFLNIDFAPLLANINALGPSGLAVIVIGIGIVLLLISYMLSCQIMDKKEF